MINSIKKSFNILRNNTLFIQPLLLYVLTLLSILMYLNGRTLTFYPRIMLLVAVVLLFIAFSAGWFYIIKQGITSYNENDSREEITAKSIANFKKFFEGVGVEFFRLAGAFIIIFLVYSFVIYCLSRLCLHYFGMPEIYNDFLKLQNASSQAEKLNIINNIPVQSQMVFMKWAIVLYPVSLVLNFWAVLYSGIVFFEQKNIISCFFKSIAFFFKNIGINIAIIVFLQVLYIFLNILSVCLGVNVFALFITTMLLAIYLNYYLVLVFCLYYGKQQNNSDSGSQFIGKV